jgi:hypothetical protein
VLDDDHSTVGVVTFTTDGEAPGWVEYGVDGALDRRTPVTTGTDHVQPLLGLKAGRSYSWRVVATEADRTATSPVKTVAVPPVPEDFPTFALVTLDRVKAGVANAYITVAGAAAPGVGSDDPDAMFYVAILDADGDFVWYHALPPGRGTSALDISFDRQSVWWMEVDNHRVDPDSEIVRMTLDGTVLSRTLAVSGHHAAAELPGGEFVHLGRTFTPDPPAGTLMTDRVMRVTEGDLTGASGVELFDYVADWWSGDPDVYWIARDLPIQELYGYQDVFDMTHSNSIAFLDGDGAVYPYARSLDTLMKLDAATGELQWQMSGKFSDFSLPDGEPIYAGPYDVELWSAGHYSQIWSDGLTMFDNGDNYTPQVSSIVEIAYDEAAGTAEEVFRYTDPDNGWTNSLGDVWKIPNGNYVASWMSISKLTEVTPDGELVWELEPLGGTAVRRVRLIEDLYGLTPLADLPPLP